MLRSTSVDTRKYKVLQDLNPETEEYNKDNPGETLTNITLKQENEALIQKNEILTQRLFEEDNDKSLKNQICFNVKNIILLEAGGFYDAADLKLFHLCGLVDEKTEEVTPGVQEKIWSILNEEAKQKIDKDIKEETTINKIKSYFPYFSSQENKNIGEDEMLKKRVDYYIKNKYLKIKQDLEDGKIEYGENGLQLTEEYKRKMFEFKVEIYPACTFPDTIEKIIIDRLEDLPPPPSYEIAVFIKHLESKPSGEINHNDIPIHSD